MNYAEFNQMMEESRERKLQKVDNFLTIEERSSLVEEIQCQLEEIRAGLETEKFISSLNLRYLDGSTPNN